MSIKMAQPITKEIMLEIIKNGIYYFPCSKHYASIHKVVCDRCSKMLDELDGCIGYDSDTRSFDFCMKCSNDVIKINKLSIENNMTVTPSVENKQINTSLTNDKNFETQRLEAIEKQRLEAIEKQHLEAIEKQHLEAFIGQENVMYPNNMTKMAQRQFTWKEKIGRYFS